MFVCKATHSYMAIHLRVQFLLLSASPWDFLQGSLLPLEGGKNLEERGWGGRDPKMETKMFYDLSSKVNTIYSVYHTIKHILLVTQNNQSGMWEDMSLQCGYQELGILGPLGRLATMILRYIAKLLYLLRKWHTSYLWQKVTKYNLCIHD